MIYPTATGFAVGQIYRIPDNKPRAAAVLSLGVANLGFEDPDAVNLGYALARAGIVVMYHWSPVMGLQSRIEPGEIDNIASAVEYLKEQPFVDGTRVGIGGFCVGASLALVAAAEPRIRDDVLVVFAFGPYFDGRTLLLEAASREVRHGGTQVSWEPAPITMKVLANEYIGTLERPAEAELLRRRYLEGHEISARELEGLSPEAHGILKMLDGVGRPQAEAIYEAFPDSFHRGIARISPSQHMDGIRGRLLLMHERDDKVVPAAESRRLAETLEGRNSLRYTEFVAFDHVTPRDEGTLALIRQASRLYLHMHDVLRIAG